MGFNSIYWTPMSGSYFFGDSIFEKYGKIWKNGHFSGRIWPDCGNTIWADMAGLGSIGLTCTSIKVIFDIVIPVNILVNYS